MVTRTKEENPYTALWSEAVNVFEQEKTTDPSLRDLKEMEQATKIAEIAADLLVRGKIVGTAKGRKVGKIVPKSFAEVTKEYLTQGAQKTYRKYDTYTGHVRQVVAFLVWLHDVVKPREYGLIAREPLTIEDMCAPAREENVPSGLMSMRIAEEYGNTLYPSAKTTRQYNVAIKNFISWLRDESEIWPPGGGFILEKIPTTAPPAEKTKGFLLLANEVDIFFNRLCYGLKPYEILFARYLLATGLRPEHAIWLRITDLEAARAKLVKDATGEWYHQIDVNDYMMAAREYKGETVAKVTIKGYPRVVHISSGLYRDMMDYVHKEVFIPNIRYGEFKKLNYDDLSKAQKTELAKERKVIPYRDLTSEEKLKSRVWWRMNMEPTVLANTLEKRRKTPEKWGLPLDNSKYVPYSLRNTWTSVVARLTNLDTAAKLQGWTTTRMALGSYMDLMSLSDAWTIKTKYGIYVPEAALPAEDVKHLKISSASEYLQKALEDVMAQGMPVETAYRVLLEAGVPKAERPSKLREAQEMVRVALGKTYELPPENVILEQSEKAAEQYSLTRTVDQLKTEKELLEKDIPRRCEDMWGADLVGRLTRFSKKTEQAGAKQLVDKMVKEINENLAKRRAGGK
jgi:hypothetical protein